MLNLNLKPRINLNLFLLFISTFIFYFFIENGSYRIPLTILNLIIVITLLIKNRIKLSLRCIYPILILIALCLYYIFEKLLRGYSYSYHFFIAILSLLTAIIYISYISKIKNINSLIKIINIIIVFHLSMFFLQIISWYIFKIDLDILYSLGIEKNPHRSMFYGSFRATGFYSEPSIYSTFMFSLVVIKYLFIKRTTPLMWFALISICLSFSTMGIIQVILYFVIAFMRFNIKNILSLLIVITIGFTFFFENLTQRYTLYSDGDDASNLSKINIFTKWITNDNLINFGFSYIDKFNAGIEYIALGDLTYWVNNYTFFGVYFGTFFLFIYIIAFFSGGRYREKLLLSVVLLKLSTLTYPLTSLILCYFFSICYKNKGK